MTKYLVLLALMTACAPKQTETIGPIYFGAGGVRGYEVQLQSFAYYVPVGKLYERKIMWSAREPYDQGHPKEYATARLAMEAWMEREGL